MANAVTARKVGTKVQREARITKTLNTKIRNIAFNKRPYQERVDWTNRLIAIADASKRELEKELNISGDIGELAAAVHYNLRLYPDGHPHSDGVQLCTGGQEVSIKCITPDCATPANLSRHTIKVDMNGKWAILAIVALGLNFEPIEIVAASKKEIRKVLYTHLCKATSGHCPSLKGVHKIHFSWIRELNAANPIQHRPDSPFAKLVPNSINSVSTGS